MLFQIFCLLALIGTIESCTNRNVTVVGTVACGNHKQQNVRIELLSPDDSLNKTVSDHEGNFHIYGEECEHFGIEPYLRITHNCDGGVNNKRCIITDDFPIPKEFIDKKYDMGIVSLNIARSNHKKTCTSL
ncbi:unnamed protein product [Enterobius vermicularis]|uniref:Transthyretin-like family protein n=1 Tax=Enterobius vermicularis TaxID=51028 RepID=A0A0N4VHP9_ENTVE|nr:unnamed protein product [Enterobius vermicularis]